MNTENQSTMSLLSQLGRSIPDLFRKEVQLLRAEIDESTSRAMTAVGLIVGALLVAVVALNVLAAALVTAVAETGIPAGWAALIVGGALALVALIVASKGASDLKAARLKPARTVESVQKDAAVAEGVVR